jgi:hypothetical protein
LDNQENGVPESEPCISKELLMSVTRKARPSTPADEKRRYDREFGEFVSSRKSISTKVHVILILISSTVKTMMFLLKSSSILLLFLLHDEILDNYWKNSVQARESKGKKVTLA